MTAKTISLYPDGPADENQCYKLKIRLEGTKPPIQRKVLVPADINLWQLHFVIQISMGWLNAHLFQFSDKKWQNQQFRAGIPDEMDFFDAAELEAADEVKLNSLIHKLQLKHFFYWYDFGDDWWHKITILKTAKKDKATFEGYPVCIDAQGACPPEDVGGIWGYYEMLEILDDKKHPEHKEIKEWLGLGAREKIDPDFVNTSLINDILKRLPQEDIWSTTVEDFFG